MGTGEKTKQKSKERAQEKKREGTNTRRKRGIYKNIREMRKQKKGRKNIFKS